MKIPSIFLLGIAILFGAILLNLFASRVGLLSWYDFLKKPSAITVFSFFWLFVVYPLGLGLVAYWALKYLQ